MQVLPAGDVAAKLLQSPAQLSLLCSSLQQCFAFDQAAAGLLLYAGAEPAPHLSIPAAQPEGASMGDSHSSSKLESGKNEAKAAAIQSREQSAPAKQAAIAQESLSAPMLPRMPAGLAHVGSQQCYEALAAVARSIGHVALTAGMYCRSSWQDGCISAGPTKQHGCLINLATEDKVQSCSSGTDLVCMPYAACHVQVDQR